MEQYNSIQQLLKKENGHDRKPIYPSTVIQAVFDAKTGASLEAILAQFNSIYVQYQGSPQATRNIIPVEMRRAGLMITYMNMDSETITEKASSAVQKDNDHWGLDVNWSRVDELSLSGDIAVSANGTWIINGVDTKVPARGSKGDAGLTPWLKTIDNKLHYSYDNTTWEPCSDYLAGYFRFNATSSDSQAGTIGKIQISRDNKTWQDLSPEFRNYLRIQGYVASTSALPKNQVVGTIYGVNEGTNTYSLHVWDGSTWVNNGTFTSIAAGVVQETGDSETEVMSQKAVTEKLSELGSEFDTNIANDITGKTSSKRIVISEYSGDYNNGWIGGENSSFPCSEAISVNEYKSILIKNALPYRTMCYSEKPAIGNNTSIFLGTLDYWGNPFIEGTKYVVVMFANTSNPNGYDNAMYNLCVANDESLEKRFKSFVEQTNPRIELNEKSINDLLPYMKLNTTKISSSVVAGYNSEKYYTITPNGKNYNVSLKYNNGYAAFAVIAYKLGTVAEVKSGRFLHIDNVEHYTDFYFTYNRTADWSRNKIGWAEKKAIKGGFSFSLSDEQKQQLNNLNDADIIYCMMGFTNQNASSSNLIIGSYNSYIVNSDLNQWMDKDAEDIPDGFIQNTERRLNILESGSTGGKKIVAWGDSITMAYGRTAYTEYMKEKLSDYDIINCGVGGETISTIMARQGSDVALTSKSFVLPKNKSSVVVADGTTSNYLKSAYDGKTIAPLLQGTGGTSTWTSDSVNPCYIDGIECKLSKVTIGENGLVASNVQWVASRVNEGERDISFPENTPIVLSGASKYKNPTAAIFFCYQNGGYNNIDDLVAKLRKMVEAANTSIYLVVGIYTSVNNAFENRLLKEFGCRFFNSRVYLSGNAMYDLKLTPTTDDDLTELQKNNNIPSDVAQMKLGLVPSTFWNQAYRDGESSKDSIHLNSLGYQALGYKMADLLKSLGA